MSETVKEIFQEYMAEIGIDQSEIAVRLQISNSSVSHIMNGRLRVSAELAANIERELGIPAERFRPDVFHGLTAKPEI